MPNDSDFYENLRDVTIVFIIFIIMLGILILLEQNKSDVTVIYGNPYFIFEKKDMHGKTIKYIIIPKYKTKTGYSNIDISLFLVDHSRLPLFRSLTNRGNAVPILTDDDKYSLSILEGMALYRYNNGRDDFINLLK
jgi:hypothetical protein